MNLASLLTIPQAARRVKRTKKTLYTMIQNGEIASVTVGDRQYIDPAIIPTIPLRGPGNPNFVRKTGRKRRRK